MNNLQFEIHKCCICKEEFEGFGNNPQPIKQMGYCCNKCNREKVIPARLKIFFEVKNGNANNK